MKSVIAARDVPHLRLDNVSARLSNLECRRSPNIRLRPPTSVRVGRSNRDAVVGEAFKFDPPCNEIGSGFWHESISY